MTWFAVLGLVLLTFIWLTLTTVSAGIGQLVAAIRELRLEIQHLRITHGGYRDGAN